MSVTSYQFRAARALKDWSLDDVEALSGVSRQTVYKFENGIHRLHKETEAALLGLLDTHGIELIADRGVALRNDNYRLLEGPDCYLRLLDEVYQTLHGQAGAEVLSICTDDSVSPPEVAHAIQRWHDAGIPCRFLTHEYATRFDFPLREYRMIPHRFYTNSVMVVFADKVAVLRGANDAVLVVRDKEKADMLRGLFEMIWLQSPAPARAP